MDSDRPTSTGRGGRRCLTDRLSRELSSVQCENVAAAARHALESGTPLNRFVTINWSSAGVENARAATSRFLKLAGDWLSDQGVRRAYVWVRENNGGDHVHILIHVPHGLAQPHLTLGEAFKQASADFTSMSCPP